MSSPATTAFKAEWLKRSLAAVTLARITFSAPSALTIHVATRQFDLGGVVYESGLSCDPIRARFTRLGTGPEPCDTTIRIAARAFAGLGATADEALATWRWQGAAVTIYVHNDARDGAGAPVLADGDKLQQFDGVVDSYSIDDEGITLNCLQPRAFNKPIPPKMIDKISHPLAPDVSQGRPEPIVIGDFSALPLRKPWPSAYGTSKQRHEEAGAGLGAAPLLIVDPGLGAAKVKLLAAGHECVKLLDRANGNSLFYMAGGRLCPVDPTVGGGTKVVESLGATESYISIDDDYLVCFYGVVPTDVRTGANRNSASEARRASDVFDETSYATLDQTAGTDKEVLELALPNISSLGFIEAVTINVGFSGDAANTQNLRCYPFNAATAANGTMVTTAATSTTPGVLTGAWDGAYWNTNQWNLGGETVGGAPQPYDIRIDFAGASASNKARIYWATLRVQFRPQRALIAPAAVIPSYVTHRKFNTAFPGFPEGTMGTRHPAVLVHPEQYAVDGQFFGNYKGQPDSGGTYTGSGSSLIERPCDAARYLLAAYGLESSFETGATAFGSFVLARSLLRNAAPSDYKVAAYIGDATSVQQALQAICQQGLIAVYRDRFTGKWLCHVWRRGGVPDYDLVLDRSHIASIEAGVSSDVELAQGVRVKWGYDHATSRGLFETFVSATGSSQGYALPTVVDQQLVVSAANNKLDWTDVGTRVCTLANGTYAPIDLAEEIQTKMRAVVGNAVVGYGFTIKTSFNDTISVSGTPVTLNPGTYDADGLAREVERALNAAAIGGSAWTCTYSHATNLFSLTSTVVVTLGACHVLGRITADSDTAWVSEAPCYADRFYFANWTGTLLWLTGANVANNCAELVGYTRLADQSVAPGGGLPHVVAPFARGERQTACEASADSYGPRADLIVDAPWVRDESSAQQLRDRIFDFGAAPTVWVRVKTHATPDLQRLRIIQFSADLDERLPYPGYGSDGSWGGKLFRVLEVQQHIGPSYHTEFYAEAA